jgi:hypothetical protein
MAVSLSSLGDNCTKVEIFSEDLVSGHELPVLPNSLINKGILFELNQFRSEYDYSWDNLYNWLAQMSGGIPPLTLPCVKTAVSRLKKKRSELLRSKKSIAGLFKEPFFPVREPVCNMTEQPKIQA